MDEFDRADRDDHQLDLAYEKLIQDLDWAELHGYVRSSPTLDEAAAQAGRDKAAQVALSNRMLCWRCRGTGYVTVAGPDENGLYDADDCPDCGGIPHA